MKKLSILIPMFLLICVLLTGCVETDISVIIDGAGGGSVSTTFLIEKDFFDMMQGGDITGLDGMLQGETTVDGSDYISFSETKSYETYAEMEAALLDMSFLDDGSGGEEAGAAPGIFKSVEIKKDGWLFENRYTFNAVTNAQETDEEMEMSGMSFGDVFKLQLSVTMPGDISESTGGTADGNILKCDIINLTKENEITAVSTWVNVLAIVIAVLVLILVAVLMYVLLGKDGTKGR